MKKNVRKNNEARNLLIGGTIILAIIGLYLAIITIMQSNNVSDFDQVKYEQESFGRYELNQLEEESNGVDSKFLGYTFNGKTAEECLQCLQEKFDSYKITTASNGVVLINGYAYDGNYYELQFLLEDEEFVLVSSYINEVEDNTIFEYIFN